jgi:hypothetical protein
MKIRITMLFGVALAAGIAMGGAFTGNRIGAVANTEVTAGPAADNLCTTQFVTNVKIKAFRGNEFEVSWDYAPPDPCLTPDGFEVVCTVKRKVGGGILGQKTIKTGPNDRRGIFNFASAFGLDQVVASVKGTVTLKSFGTAGLDL